LVWCVSFIFATIDSNAAGDEGGGDFGGFEEEDQGHFAEQGKPPLDASLILYILFLHYYKFYKGACLLFILSVVSATWSFIIPPLGCSPRWYLLNTSLLVIWCLSPCHPCRHFSKKNWTIGWEPWKNWL
jgi:hypothetical protein